MKKFLLLLLTFICVSLALPSFADASCWSVQTPNNGRGGVTSCVEDTACNTPNENVGNFATKERCQEIFNSPIKCFVKKAQCGLYEMYRPSCDGKENFPSKAECDAGKIIPTATPFPTPTIDPLAPTPDINAVGNASYTLNPPFEDIDDSTPFVDITFNNLETPESKDSNFYVCLETDLCIDNDKIRDGVADGNEDAIAKSRRMSLSDVDEGTIQRYLLAPGSNTIKVCGDGSSQLKGSAKDNYKGKDGKWFDYMNNKNKAGCISTRDYFHPGKPYLASVYSRVQVDGEPEVWVLQSVAGFYINHHFPQISVDPTNNLVPGTQFKIKLWAVPEDKKTLIKANGWSKKETPRDTTERNNYQILVEGSGVNTRVCGYLSASQLSKEVTIPADKRLLSGKVKITISDQIDEVKNLSDAIGVGLDFKDDIVQIRKRLEAKSPFYARNPNLLNILCKGGFVYRVYECNVSTDPANNSCKLFKDYENPDYDLLVPYLDDPNKADIKGLLRYFDKLGVNSAQTTLPCQIGGIPVNDPSLCTSMDTALGKIPVDPIGFISKLFSIVLSFAGVGALLTIIYSGYRLLISRGDKEMIQKARERLTSAIVGLLFIVFALSLLSVIGWDILRIPAFK